ncbi:uncharacterized protein N7496_006151 [Penicillium cataractarum]|uniref:Life-span regulatory factor-domain-containing protein n=1 Tax=Penicillium cataractarum TaxID=2100454 RepID=A0A9W9V745_9EURO|nr:uncharacterized protein N7496_006151 [Penicillium cataractarum]KAJ5370059.1 hypothetical protein N7496_006151 [Penicillium cataractarum]
MTQSSTSHRRSPSSPHAPKSKPIVRPALHRRGTSGISLSISKLGSGQSTRSHSRGVKADDDFDMAASFLNFCAMCERQITVPNNSILYCSESCRRKDSAKPLSASLPSSSTLSTRMATNTYSYSSTYTATTSPPTSPPLSPRTIVAPMTPTRISSSTPIPSIRIPPTIHAAKSDLDPTEWKPVLGPRTDSTSSTSSLATSDAWGYLSQFHGGSSVLLTRRSHRSTASLSTLDVAATPSLTHAPSVASSVSSSASDEHEHEHMHRPLPPRHNPFFSLSHAAEKGMALVVPHVAAVAVRDAESDSGSIFPASSAVWEDDVVTKGSAPIMVRGRSRATKV